MLYAAYHSTHHAYDMLSTASCILYTVYNIPYHVYDILYTIYCMLCDVYYILHAGLYFAENHSSHRNAKQDGAWVNRWIPFDSSHRFTPAVSCWANEQPIQFLDAANRVKQHIHGTVSTTIYCIAYPT